MFNASQQIVLFLLNAMFAADVTNPPPRYPSTPCYKMNAKNKPYALLQDECKELKACFQGYPESAVYVQIPIGSRNSAIHNAYHTSLRPSSLFEPRHPSLKVVFDHKVVNHPEQYTDTHVFQQIAVASQKRKTVQC